MNPSFTKYLSKKASGMTLVGSLLCIALAALILVGSLRYYKYRQAKARLSIIQTDVAHLFNDANRYFLKHCQRMSSDEKALPLLEPTLDLVPCFRDGKTCAVPSNLDTLAPIHHHPWVNAYHVYLVPMAITNDKQTDPTPTGDPTTTMFRIQVTAELTNLLAASPLCVATATALSAKKDPNSKTSSGCTIIWDELPRLTHHQDSTLWGMEGGRLRWQKNQDAALSNDQSVCTHG